MVGELSMASKLELSSYVKLHWLNKWDHTTYWIWIRPFAVMLYPFSLKTTKNSQMNSCWCSHTYWAIPRAAIGPFTLTPTHFKPYHNMAVQGKKVFLKQLFLQPHRVRSKKNISGLIKLRTSLKMIPWNSQVFMFQKQLFHAMVMREFDFECDDSQQTTEIFIQWGECSSISRSSQPPWYFITVQYDWC